MRNVLRITALVASCTALANWAGATPAPIPDPNTPEWCAYTRDRCLSSADSAFVKCFATDGTLTGAQAYCLRYIFAPTPGSRDWQWPGSGTPTPGPTPITPALPIPRAEASVTPEPVAAVASPDAYGTQDSYSMAATTSEYPVAAGYSMPYPVPTDYFDANSIVTATSDADYAAAGVTGVTGATGFTGPEAPNADSYPTATYEYVTTAQPSVSTEEATPAPAGTPVNDTEWFADFAYVMCMASMPYGNETEAPLDLSTCRFTYCASEAANQIEQCHANYDLCMRPFRPTLPFPGPCPPGGS